MHLKEMRNADASRSYKLIIIEVLLPFSASRKEVRREKTLNCFFFFFLISQTRSQGRPQALLFPLWPRADLYFITHSAVTLPVLELAREFSFPNVFGSCNAVRCKQINHEARGTRNYQNLEYGRGINHDSPAFPLPIKTGNLSSRRFRLGSFCSSVSQKS